MQNSNDIAWVLSDHAAASGSKEVSVHKGQQVEVLEWSVANNADMCLVRLQVSGSDIQPEGLVPASVLKQVPHSRVPENGKPMF